MNSFSLLWSFEGALLLRAPAHKLGGHSDGETPLPIPNREVKPVSADGTRGAIPRESRTPPIFLGCLTPQGVRHLFSSRSRPAARAAARSTSWIWSNRPGGAVAGRRLDEEAGGRAARTGEREVADERPPRPVERGVEGERLAAVARRAARREASPTDEGVGVVRDVARHHRDDRRLALRGALERELAPGGGRGPDDERRRVERRRESGGDLGSRAGSRRPAARGGAARRPARRRRPDR